MRLLLALCLLPFAFNVFAYDIVRDEQTRFPRCLDYGTYSYVFRWKERAIDRLVEVAAPNVNCGHYKGVIYNAESEWYDLKSARSVIPARIYSELLQIEQKTNELRVELSAEDYLLAHPIEEYTTAINRNLSARFGQMFSAQVFKAYVESKNENKALKESVLKDLRLLKSPKNKPFSEYSDRVKIVVSFGLGWEEKYNMTTPFYIRDFLNDIKALGLPVVFLKKNPFGRVSDNIEKVIPQLEDELAGGKDLILISLCKGTPEILGAEARLSSKIGSGKILGHVNLSGMLGGAILSDFSKEVVLPKLVAPLLKRIPYDEIRDSAKMVDALDFMKTSLIESALNAATPDLSKDIFYINVTGAPMSGHVFKSNSPMKPILQYNVRNAFIISANDGFLELPNTLIPKTISSNQATIVLDSSHLLADGLFEEFKIEDEKTRRIFYYSIIKTILTHENSKDLFTSI